MNKPFETESYKNFKKEYEENIHADKKKKEENQIKFLKAKNFGKIIMENMTPTINEIKMKERENKFIKKKYVYQPKPKNPYNKYTVKLKKKLNNNMTAFNYSNFSEDSLIRPNTARSKNRKQYFLDHYDITNNRPISAEIGQDSLYPNKSVLHKQASYAKNLPEIRTTLRKSINYLVDLKSIRLSKNSSTKSIKKNIKLEEFDKIYECKYNII